jgi:dolichol-phosphate mannosyltransferase
MNPEISAVIPTLNEAGNVSVLLPDLHAALHKLSVPYEIIVVDGNSSDGTQKVASANGAHVILEPRKGYGYALRAGFRAARGTYVLTMDADLSHPPEFVSRLWQARNQAELLIGSRYVSGGWAEMSRSRRLLSRVLNIFFCRSLSIPVNDMSSGFRMYKKSALDSIEIGRTDFGVLIEILISIYAQGWRVQEVPIHYRPRTKGRSHAKLLKFGIEYLRIFVGAWRKRNSILFADYDERAFDSKIPLQRWWQRKRFRIVTAFVPRNVPTLDVGCGSSRIIANMPHAVALDMSLGKLRYIRKSNSKLINATAGQLPFKTGSFRCVICSEVIEHTAESTIFSELHRVLPPGGCLIIGTPDYAKMTWRIIESLYGLVHRGGYADEHITHYTREVLRRTLENEGFEIESQRYICNAEMIMLARKSAEPKFTGATSEVNANRRGTVL